MRWLLVVAVVVGCGDNTLPVGAPLLHARDLTIIAHPDDDLVFMQPDLLERTVTGGLTNVYVTDGSIEAGARRLGLMAAYTAASGHSGWACGWIDVIGHAAQHCRLEDAHLSLVFLGLPEGNEAGDSPTSIRRLWEGDLDIAITIGDRPASYLRGDVIRVLAELIDLTAPKTIRTLELADTHGPDHADHVITGAVTLLAVAASQSNPELIAFRGESTRLEAPNMIEPLFLRSASILAHYRACAEGCAVCGEACAPVDDDRADFLRRRYAVSLRRTAQGALRSGTECVSADPAGVLALGTCTGIELVVLAADGTLHIGDRCVSVQASGDLLAKDICSAGANQRFFFDDEGHIWLGVPPPATPGDALQCLTLDAGVVHAGRCGATTAATWEISPAFVSTPRPQGLTKTGRAVRLADIDGDRRADLCAIETGNLACALGDGAGGFDPAVILHALAVEPESLMIGDVDGDGLADACGRDAGGITCATAITGFVPERWTLAFAHPGPADAGDRSLAAIDADGNGSAEICGLAPPGLVCAGHAGLPVVQSRWPDRNAPLWPADLDGDDHADWCSATATGAACGLALHQLITSDGVPWSFSQAGVVDPAPIDTNTGALADIDGDGRADLCSIRGNQVVCARSQGFGFGPTAVVSTLPAGSAPTALWLGDLDGNGTADVCVDDAGTIRCIR
ncbi:MAG: FG-GAP-like repeat-containing protein [Kofleriaceae bacterium]